MDTTLATPADDPKAGGEAKEVRFGYIDNFVFIKSPEPHPIPRMTKGRDVVADIKQAMRGG